MNLRELGIKEKIEIKKRREHKNKEKENGKVVWTKRVLQRFIEVKNEIKEFTV